MPKYRTVTELKKLLKTLKQDELIALVCDVYNRDETARQILSAKFSDDSFKSGLLEEYKQIMHKMFFPRNMDDFPALRDVKKLITRFGHVVDDPRFSIDLTLYYVECGTEYTNTFGDIDEPFYNSMCSVFGDVVHKLNQMDDPAVYDLLKDRLRRLVDETRNIGWGYGDFICENYCEIVWVQKEEE